MRVKEFSCTSELFTVAPFVTDSLKNLHALAKDRTGDHWIYHFAIKEGLYHKALQVYDTRYLYPVTYSIILYHQPKSTLL